jgi:pyrroloquinoline quinone (PQQ) biosynthesis protein C
MTLTETSPNAARSTSRHRESLTATPNPAWATDMIERLHSDWEAVHESPVFDMTSPDAPRGPAWRAFILEHFCIVENFPKYMGLELAKTTYGLTPKDYLARAWLIGNIRVEARHAEWYIDWGTGHGLTREELFAHRPAPAAGALDSWLWSVAHRGTLAESIGAINYAVEGTTGEWCRKILPAFRGAYPGDKVTLAWLAGHAEYDDKHPVQAFEIIKNALSADGEPSREQVQRVEDAIRRSLHLLRATLDGCATR